MDERGLMALIVTFHPGLALASCAWATALTLGLSWVLARRGRRVGAGLRLTLWLALAATTHASLTQRAGLKFGDLEIVRVDQ